MTLPIETQSFDLLVDAVGLVCPEPVMLVHSAVAKLSKGDVLKVIATDPSSARDIPKFCRFLDHELIAMEQIEETWFYFIRCG